MRKEVSSMKECILGSNHTSINLSLNYWRETMKHSSNLSEF